MRAFLALFQVVVWWATLIVGSKATATHDEVVVGTYNIRTASKWARNDGGDERNGRTWRQRRKAVAKSIRISGASVVGTQEGLGWQLDSLLELLGPGWNRIGVGRYHGTRDSGGDEDEIAAIIYNTAIVKRIRAGDFWLSETPEVSSKGWGASLPRVASWATFECGSRAFTVLNAHLDHASSEARGGAAALLRKRVALLKESETPVVFTMGDFNAVKTEEWYSTLTAAPEEHGNDLPLVDTWGAANMRSCGACGQGTFHAWKGSDMSSPNWVRPFEGPGSQAIAHSGVRHIDAIFLNQGALEAGAGEVRKAKMITDDKRRRSFGGPFASDHYPVVITYRWAAGTGSSNQEL